MRTVRILEAAAAEVAEAAAWYEGQCFPYDVVVREAGNEVLVIAVAHHSRRPGYWKDRPDV